MSRLCRLCYDSLAIAFHMSHALLRENPFCTPSYNDATGNQSCMSYYLEDSRCIDLSLPRPFIKHHMPTAEAQLSFVGKDIALPASKHPFFFFGAGKRTCMTTNLLNEYRKKKHITKTENNAPNIHGVMRSRRRSTACRGRSPRRGCPAMTSQGASRREPCKFSCVAAPSRCGGTADDAGAGAGGEECSCLCAASGATPFTAGAATATAAAEAS